jgi:hypothetical protein
MILIKLILPFEIFKKPNALQGTRGGLVLIPTMAQLGLNLIVEMAWAWVSSKPHSSLSITSFHISLSFQNLIDRDKWEELIQ